MCFLCVLLYELYVSVCEDVINCVLCLIFSNIGMVVVVFYVYDCLYLDCVLCCYVVELGKMFDDMWDVFIVDKGKYDLWVFGFNGFYCVFLGDVSVVLVVGVSVLEICVCYDLVNVEVYVMMMNIGIVGCIFIVKLNVYCNDGLWMFDILVGK